MRSAEKPTGLARIGQRIIAIVLSVMAIAMAVYQLAFTQYLIQDPTGHRITHLGFALVVCSLALLTQKKHDRRRALKMGLLLGSLVVSCYFLVCLDAILMYRNITPLTLDLIMGGVLMFLTFVLSCLIFGMSFPILGVVFVGYLYFGRYLPYPFTVAAVPVERMLMWLTIPGVQEGIYGDILAISANYLFLFIFFGAVLQAFGGLRFIMTIAQWIGSKLKAGPAVMALFGSSLLGTLTGSTVANVTITGSFTIPLMKKAGYRPEQAGAIEAVSSNGGQIMPPIMGATAFIMAGFAGIPYLHIMLAALIPALLYYFGVFCYVTLAAQRLEIAPILKPTSAKQLLLDAPLFFIPLGVLVFLLAQGYSLSFVGFWSIMAVVLVGLISSIRKDARLSFKTVIEDLTKGVQTGSEMAVVTALISIIATCIKVTGIGIKLPIVIADISHGYLIIALLIALVASILLGMGVPTPVAYMLVAIGVVPALRTMGVPLLSAHFFCFISAVFSHITPPIAVGALVASRMAYAKFWATCWEAVKAGVTAFLLPFFVIYIPVLTLQPEEGPIMTSLAQIAAILFGVLSLQMVLSKYCLSDLRLSERVGFLICSVCFLSFAFTRSYHLFFAGLVLIIVGVAVQLIRRGKHVLF